jgi:hypothetical protein
VGQFGAQLLQGNVAADEAVVGQPDLTQPAGCVTMAALITTLRRRRGLRPSFRGESHVHGPQRHFQSSEVGEAADIFRDAVCRPSRCRTVLFLDERGQHTTESQFR